MKVGDKDFFTFKSLKTPSPESRGARNLTEKGSGTGWKSGSDISGKDAATKWVDVYDTFLIISFSLVSDSNKNKNKRAGVQHTQRTAAQGPTAETGQADPAAGRALGSTRSARASPQGRRRER